MISLRALAGAVIEYLRAWWRGPEPTPYVDVRDPLRKRVIANAEFNLRAENGSRVGRVSRQPTPFQREGRMVRFVRAGETLGRSDYNVIAVRGGLPLGRLTFRSQWGQYAYYPMNDGVATPLNQEILAEIYAMLRELRQA